MLRIYFGCHVGGCTSRKLECEMQFRVSEADIHAHCVENITVDLETQGGVWLVEATIREECWRGI